MSNEQVDKLIGIVERLTPEIIKEAYTATMLVSAFWLLIAIVMVSACAVGLRKSLKSKMDQDVAMPLGIGSVVIGSIFSTVAAVNVFDIVIKLCSPTVSAIRYLMR